MRHWATLSIFAAGIFAASIAIAGEEDLTLTSAPGHELTLGRCIVCHSIDYIQSNAAVMTRDAWQRSIRKMIDRFGAPITDAEAEAILEYLVAHYSIEPRVLVPARTRER